MEFTYDPTKPATANSNGDVKNYEIITGVDIFIIPNVQSHIRAENETRPTRQYPLWDMKVYDKDLDKDGRIEISAGEDVVQCWITGLGSENWQDHFIPDEVLPGNGAQYEQDDFPCKRMNTYFPREYFEGKLEGDTIELNVLGNKLVITLNQMKYRYRRFGEFHTVLRSV